MDIAAIRQRVDDAYAAEADLLAERRENRATMSKADFVKYNEKTAKKQRSVQAEIDAAEAELTKALNNARQELLVGTMTEKGAANG